MSEYQEEYFAMEPIEFHENEHDASIEHNINNILTFLNSSPVCKNGCCHEEFKIQSLEYLDEIDVRTYIEISYDAEDEEYLYSLRINEKKYNTILYDEIVHTSTELTRKVIKDLFDIIIRKFDKLKYCKIRNIFSHDKYHILCDGKYMNLSKVNNCSVCLDRTSSKAKCGHFTCLQCAAKIDNGLCPICRGYIMGFY